MSEAKDESRSTAKLGGNLQRTEMEQVNVIGMKSDGSSDLIGTIPMPPSMKMREIAKQYFGEIGPDDDGDLCVAALEDFHAWLLKQGWVPPEQTLTPNG